MKKIQFTLSPIEFFDAEKSHMKEIVVSIDLDKEMAFYTIYERNDNILPSKDMDYEKAVELLKGSLSRSQIIPPLYGATEFADEIGWKLGKISVYDNRGKLPVPALKIGKRSFWTKEQVDRFKNQLALNIK